MTDYHSPTVVVPPIPLSDMTALELMLLSLIFDESIEYGASYYHIWCGPSDVVTVDAEDLRGALAESREIDSPLNDLVGSLLEKHDAIEEDRPDDIDLDLTEPGMGWPEIFQAIVRRSPSLEEILVTTAFTCTKMRPDGFGGSITRITAEAIQSSSTLDMLSAMRAASTSVGVGDSGHETRRRLEAIAGNAGWDSFTLLLLIARRLVSTGSAQDLIRHLEEVAASAHPAE
ncbi:hypothetical protein [Shinella sumterensis]|uniref:Uncharacterized protein n=1 Tax=Shinella sumterensis TaxID=1967501 RepID=A0AA50CUT6_9HYPH|nr:hypothetical protein [Shinella sumterensis]WLS00990.1 hypothetical protein Q9313_26710 [Shinella sumterensis]WLS11770.1 hypothetical protein Q9314_27445 [Shinella sumterensis]